MQADLKLGAARGDTTATTPSIPTSKAPGAVLANQRTTYEVPDSGVPAAGTSDAQPEKPGFWAHVWGTLVATRVEKRAGKFRRAGKYDEMLAYTTKQLAKRPDNPGIQYAHAMALKHAGKVDEAIGLLETIRFPGILGEALAPLLDGARAGYLAKAGRASEAQALFSKTEGKLDDGMRAWYFAITGDREAMLGALRNKPAAAELVRDDVEFDPYRKDPEFAAAVAALPR